MEMALVFQLPPVGLRKVIAEPDNCHGMKAGVGSIFTD
jgi:hypothetical protein